jgi:hypothetical protein
VPGSYDNAHRSSGRLTPLFGYQSLEIAQDCSLSGPGRIIEAASFFCKVYVVHYQQFTNKGAPLAILFVSFSG